jgi:hypothetical protein
MPCPTGIASNGCTGSEFQVPEGVVQEMDADDRLAYVARLVYSLEINLDIHWGHLDARPHSPARVRQELFTALFADSARLASLAAAGHLLGIVPRPPSTSMHAPADSATAA